MNDALPASLNVPELFSAFWPAALLTIRPALLVALKVAPVAIVSVPALVSVVPWSISSVPSVTCTVPPALLVRFASR